MINGETEQEREREQEQQWLSELLGEKKSGSDISENKALNERFSNLLSVCFTAVKFYITNEAAHTSKQLSRNVEESAKLLDFV